MVRFFNSTPSRSKRRERRREGGGGNLLGDVHEGIALLGESVALRRVVIAEKVEVVGKVPPVLSIDPVIAEGSQVTGVDRRTRPDAFLERGPLRDKSKGQTKEGEGGRREGRHTRTSSYSSCGVAS